MWYYVIDGQQQGPVDDAGLDGLLASHSLTPETLVWKEGLAEWIPLRQARTGLAAASPVTDHEATCMVCHKKVGADNLIDLVGVRVCAECKPLALQSMKEGALISGSNMAWSDGKQLIVRNGAHLPQRCVKCNSATNEPAMERKVFWHYPLFYLLLFVNIIIYVIVAIFVRKKATIHVYLCREHRQKRMYFLIGTWVGTIAGIFAIIGGLSSNTGWVAGLGAIVLVASLLAGLFGATVTRTIRIKDNTVWLKGASKEFLASLPPWSGFGA